MVVLGSFGLVEAVYAALDALEDAFAGLVGEHVGGEAGVEGLPLGDDALVFFIEGLAAPKVRLDRQEEARLRAEPDSTCS